MIHSAKSLSPDQRSAIESLLGRSIRDEEQVTLGTLPPVPEWLESIQRDAKARGVDSLSMEEIDAEIAATRRDRLGRENQPGR
jgi:hypothetical protein